MTLFFTLLLTACGGDSDVGSSEDFQDETTEKVDMTGQWNMSGSFNICPGLEASFILELTDFDTNGTLNSMTRYSGILIDTENCSLDASSTDIINISSFSYNSQMTEDNLIDFVKDTFTEYYELEKNDISVTVHTFSANELSYSATAVVEGEIITETGTFSK